ncbi:MAG: lipoyl domain-containing protein [Desulfurococcales archaeon]|nr:lipoyl domain-containing protein [Desulfurococcales archaeon]MEB3780537.1 lipoyl domain-containing protein [Desulfurococcales archaeon]
MVLEVKLPRELWPRRGDWEGRVLAVYKKPGDRVSMGEPIAEVEIEKAVLVIESPIDGIVTGVNVRVGSLIKPGMVIASIKPLGGVAG